MDKLEKKYGKYAIRNLTGILIICYAVGYILRFAGGGLLDYLTLNPVAILHGQVWRLVSWILIPPTESNLFFALIMLYFYYSIGTTMEHVWGEFRYNVYIFGGMLLMILAAFLATLVLWMTYGGTYGMDVVEQLAQQISPFFSTYYINMSILLAFAATFPDNVVLFMFIIPLKMKWLGIFYGLWLVYEAVSSVFNGMFYIFFAIAASLLNFALFYVTSGRGMRLRPKSMGSSGSSRFGTAQRMAGARTAAGRTGQQQSPKIVPHRGVTKHKCAICGKTEVDDPNLEFRFCSKCNGNYEYCQEHLFTHAHVK
ncbi:MAG: hypothetical protein IJT34_09230 [Butyrivibrio sp.]|nr:hypothetical protein [Butyrivibrio sp.]